MSRVKRAVAASEGWHPDPAGRYSHRWWDGQEWTSRVFAQGRVLHDDEPIGAVAKGRQLYCGVCHIAQEDADWRGRCARCGHWLTRGYTATRPRVRAVAVMQAAREAFDAHLAEADLAIGDHNQEAAIRHLDAAVVYGTLTRAVAGVAGVPGAEPIERSVLGELHIQALRLMARGAAAFAPDVFELLLLRRFAAMYAPDREHALPETAPGLVAWCASRVAWAEAELPAANGVLADYCSSFDWLSIRHALVRLGYGFGTSRALEAGRDAAAALLGVDTTASPVAIKKAYYAAAAKYHPDVLGDVPAPVRAEAEEMMKEINLAYALLRA